MKSIMKIFGGLLAATLGLLLPAQAQTADFSAEGRFLAPGGGVITFHANLHYAEQPAAIGWMIEVPSTWSLVKVDGGNVPQVVPSRDASGNLEFAYTQVPPSSARFTVTLRYPANEGAATITPTVVIRSGGKPVTLSPTPVAFGRR